MVAFTNAACMGLLAASALTWSGTPKAEKINLAVAIIQFLLLCGTLNPTLVIESNKGNQK